ncbi:multivesicular body subunit 12A isoform X2 [Corvus hawaiiensis]|uniref:multivesicular body subunit 12A isoform X2 n=1 Tax=Corvus hawaiiensis TaxID=134902 RepID=UPI002018DD40|nr:multivesicular body subunit 12A isoform X2 [Corvus hawaiiensis]
MAAAAAPAPLTGVGWAGGAEAVPPGWTAITVTAEGAPACLGKGFGHRGGGGGWYLCFSRGGAQAAEGPVVTDVLVLSERSPQPPGYSRAPEFPESRGPVSVSRYRCPVPPVSRRRAGAGAGVGGCPGTGTDSRFPQAGRCRCRWVSRYRYRFPFPAGGPVSVGVPVPVPIPVSRRRAGVAAEAAPGAPGGGGGRGRARAPPQPPGRPRPRRARLDRGNGRILALVPEGPRAGRGCPGAAQRRPGTALAAAARAPPASVRAPGDLRPLSHGRNSLRPPPQIRARAQLPHSGGADGEIPGGHRARGEGIPGVLGLIPGVLGLIPGFLGLIPFFWV